MLAGMNVNIWEASDMIQARVRNGRMVDPGRLADPSAPLDPAHRRLIARLSWLRH